MPSDQNPWNIGGGNRPPANTPPPSGAPWGGGPHGRLPPDIERFLNELRALWRRIRRLTAACRNRAERRSVPRQFSTAARFR